MPAWVGGGDYYSADAQDYLVSWCQCMFTAANQTVVDYLGFWNEPFWRSDTWGTVDFVVELRRKLDASGFAKTKLVLLDGATGNINTATHSTNGVPPDFLAALRGNATFRDAVEVVGYHYSGSMAAVKALQSAKPKIKIWETENSPVGWGALSRLLGA